MPLAPFMPDISIRHLCAAAAAGHAVAAAAYSIADDDGHVTLQHCLHNFGVRRPLITIKGVASQILFIAKISRRFLDSSSPRFQLTHASFRDLR